MKLFKSREQPQKGSSIPRVVRLSDSELMHWMDSLIMQLGSAYDVWRDHGELPEEVDKSIEAITEVWAEMRKRQDGRNAN